MNSYDANCIAPLPIARISLGDKPEKSVLIPSSLRMVLNTVSGDVEVTESAGAVITRVRTTSSCNE